MKESLAELKKKYKKVLQDECEPHWNLQYKSSAKVLVCQLHPKPMREDTKGIGFKCDKFGLQQLKRFYFKQKSISML